MVFGETQDSTLNAEDMLSFRGRIRVPRDGELIYNALAMSHGLLYSVPLGVTKMCRDLRLLYW